MTRKCHVRFGGEGEETRLPNKAGGCALPLPYHEYRERWVYQEWYWYESVRGAGLEQQRVSRQDARWLIDARYRECEASARQAEQSNRGRIFELLADFTDEDGAWAEMEDLPPWLLDDDEDGDLR